MLDYRDDDFDRRCADLDSIIDFTGRYGERSLAVLRPGGTLIMVPSGVDTKVHELAEARKQRSTGILVEPDPVGLAGLCDLIERGKLQIEVDEVFDLRPGSFREELNLHRPIYQKTAAYGHFGRDDSDFTWERTDKADALRAAAGI